MTLHTLMQAAGQLAVAGQRDWGARRLDCGQTTTRVSDLRAENTRSEATVGGRPGLVRPDPDGRRQPRPQRLPLLPHPPCELPAGNELDIDAQSTARGLASQRFAACNDSSADTNSNSLEVVKNVGLTRLGEQRLQQQVVLTVGTDSDLVIIDTPVLSLYSDACSPGVLVCLQPVHETMVRHILNDVELGETLRSDRGRRRVRAW